MENLKLLIQELFLPSLWWNKIVHGLVCLQEYSAHESALMRCYAPWAGSMHCVHQSVLDCTGPGHHCRSPPLPDPSLLTSGNRFLSQGAAAVQDLHPQWCFRVSHREQMGGREFLDLGSADLDSRGSFVTDNLSSHCLLTSEVAWVILTYFSHVTTMKNQNVCCKQKSPNGEVWKPRLDRVMYSSILTVGVERERSCVLYIFCCSLMFVCLLIDYNHWPFVQVTT